MAQSSVFIVDDDRGIARLCQRVLERASYKVIVSTDPNDALEMMETHKFDLLLSDIRMPQMDGFELISRAKQIQPNISVLVMTGFGSVDIALQALHRGVDGLILKPFENHYDLVAAVQRVLTASRERLDAARAHALRPLFDISETLLSETNPEILEMLIMNALQDLYQSRSSGVYNEADGDYGLMMARGVKDKCETPEWCQMSDFITSRETPEVVLASGGSEDAATILLNQLGWSALMVAPVSHERVRFIFFATREEGSAPFSESDLEMFTILARQATVALENSRLYTDLRHSLQQVEDSQRALVQAEKMAAVGRLMASLAHEINNPLQAVRNCLHLASRNGVEEKQREVYLGMMDGELDRLVNTVRHMLDFYRPGKREKEFVEVGAAVERVLHLLKPQMTHQNIECDMLIRPDIPQIFAVRDQVQQVFFNLLINSMDAMDNTPAPKRIWIEANVVGPMLSIRLEDSGPGISPEMQGKLFEPFTSTKKNGTGLGLAVSYGIIETHGGQMRLTQPQHGKGACFELLFPLEKGR